jgi:hypothetical protein
MCSFQAAQGTIQGCREGKKPGTKTDTRKINLLSVKRALTEVPMMCNILMSAEDHIKQLTGNRHQP